LVSRANVDLPEPFAPRTATVSPSPMSSDTPPSAGSGLPEAWYEKLASEKLITV